MLDLNKLHDNPDQYKKSLKTRGFDFDFDGFLELDGKVKKNKQEIEALNHEKNVIVRDIALSADNNKQKRQLILKLKQIKSQIDQLGLNSKKLYSKYEKLLTIMPNLLSEKVGKSRKIVKKVVKSAGNTKVLKLDWLDVLAKRGLIVYNKKSKKILEKKDEILKFESGIGDYLYNKFYKKGFEVVGIKKGLDKDLGGSSNLAYLCDSLKQSRIDVNDLPMRKLFLTNYDNIEIISLLKMQDAENELEFYIDILDDIYADLGLKFQNVMASGSEMDNIESIKYCFQLLGENNCKIYMMGEVSNYLDYISRDLGIRCNLGKRREYIAIVRAKICNIKLLLQLVVENYCNNDMRIRIPFKMKKCINIGEI